MATSSDNSLEVAAFVNKWKFVSFGTRIEDNVTLTSEDSKIHEVRSTHEVAQLNWFCRIHLFRNSSDHVLVSMLKTNTFQGSSRCHTWEYEKDVSL